MQVQSPYSILPVPSPRLYYITAHYAHRSTKSLRLIVRSLFALKQEEEKKEREKEGGRRRGEHITKKDLERKKKKRIGGKDRLSLWFGWALWTCCVAWRTMGKMKQDKGWSRWREWERLTGAGKVEQIIFRQRQIVSHVSSKCCLKDRRV